MNVYDIHVSRVIIYRFVSRGSENAQENYIIRMDQSKWNSPHIWDHDDYWTIYHGIKNDKITSIAWYGKNDFRLKREIADIKNIDN